VFLDTSGLVAAVNSDDQWHVRANEVWRDLMTNRTPLLTTSLVLVELGDGLSRVGERPIAIQVRDRLRASSRVEIVQVTAELESLAWELFRARPDKEWGVTDCVSFTVMNERGMREAFTLDHHFEQTGFVRLIK
jgi:predicted nucleic acid-binding protein